MNFLLLILLISTIQSFNNKRELSKSETIRNFKLNSIIECPETENTEHIQDGKGYEEKDQINNKNLCASEATFHNTINCKLCRLIIYHSQFQNVTSPTIGGAIYLNFESKEITEREYNLIEKCDFIGCRGAQGGAMYINSDKNCLFIKIFDSNFEENMAVSVDSSGGALYLEQTVATIQNCSFVNNVASSGCDIHFEIADTNNVRYTETIENCYFSNNFDNESLKSMISILFTNEVDVAFNDNKIVATGYPSGFHVFQTLSPFSNKYGDLSISNNFITPYEKDVVANKHAEAISEDFEKRFNQLEINESPSESSETTTSEPTETSTSEPTETSTKSEPTETSTSEHTETSITSEPTETSITSEPTETSITSEPEVVPTEEPDNSKDLPCLVIIDDQQISLKDRCSYIVSEEKKAIFQVYDTNFTDFTNESHGGAIYVINCEIECKNTNFTNCVSEGGGGGAMYVKNSLNIRTDITLENLYFTSCSALYGGAVYIYSRSEENNVTLYSCVFSSNRAVRAKTAEKSDVFYGGSSVFITSQNGNIIKCSFHNNKKNGVAFKIYNDFTNIDTNYIKTKEANILTISECIFVESKESKSSIFFISNNDGNQVEVKNCIFKGKIAKDSHFIDGKMLCKNAPKINVGNCIFENEMKTAINKDVVAVNDSNTFDKRNLNNWLKIGVLAILSIAIVSFVTFYAVKWSKNHSNENDDDDLFNLNFPLEDDIENPETN